MASADTSVPSTPRRGHRRTNATSTVALPYDDRPRQTPPPATPVNFPRHEPRDLSDYDEYTSVDLGKLFCTLRSPADLTALHIAALNLKVNRDVPIDQLIPSQFLPRPEWEEELPTASENPTSSVTSPTDKPTLSNGALAPGHQAYLTRIQELVYDNDDVYHVIERRPPVPGKQAVRSTHFRKFYQELHVAGEFWDTSLDPVPTTSANPKPSAPNDQPMVSENESSRPATPSATTTSSVSAPETTLAAHPPPPSTRTRSATPQFTYTGRRTSTGSAMPAALRNNLLASFIEPLLWAFGCRLDETRSQPRLLVRNLRIPVDMSSVAYCTPKTRPTSNVGTLEGPVLGVQGRSYSAEISGPRAAKMGPWMRNDAGGWERSREKEVKAQKEIADLLREVGAMLLLAQERAREGLEEVVPSSNAWFVTQPRWGGGTGEAIGRPVSPAGPASRTTSPAPTSPSPLLSTLDLTRIPGSNNDRNTPRTKDASEGPPLKKRSQSQTLPPRRSPANATTRETALRRHLLQRAAHPPSSRWDKRIRYARIGYPPQPPPTTDAHFNIHSECDNVYLVSSINHHVAILKLQVHPRYLAYLAGVDPETGEKVEDTAWKVEDLKREEWFVLHMQRTRWYDLFVPADRKEAARAVWGVLGAQMSA